MTTDDIDLTALLTRLDACREAREWAAGKTLEQAWAECPRGDWMLWLAGLLDIDRKVLVQAACACARLALPHVPESETRPLKAIETAEAWTRGEATIEDVRAAADAAWEAEAARAAREAARAARAAWAAADAAWAAEAARAARAARAAADAARAARAAADAAAEAVADAARAVADAARAATLARCADLVRQHIPFAEIAEKAKRL